jgi:hypothetical protein
MAQGKLVRPGSAGENDLSDLRLTTPDYAEVSPIQLPIRGEKRIIPSLVTIEATQDEVATGIAAGGQDPNTRSTVIDYDSFVISAAMKPFVDYISIRIPHRGLTNGLPDQTQSAVYRFLINPATVSVSHQTVDTQSMTRAGWQFGVWGDDVVQITLQGKTAGQYFSLGLTDLFQDFTQSYRNLQQLVMVFENNGYWFEGEELGEGPLAADFTRRRIKMHQDVELVCGNFIWSGMFDSLSISQDAESPFTSTFNISFVAWKERFRTTSPYWDSIHNDVQRGHVFGQNPTAPVQTQQPQALPAPQADPAHTPSAVASEQLQQQACTSDTAAQDQTITFDLFHPDSRLSVFAKDNPSVVKF